MFLHRIDKCSVIDMIYKLEIMLENVNKLSFNDFKSHFDAIANVPVFVVVDNGYMWILAEPQSQSLDIFVQPTYIFRSIFLSRQPIDTDKYWSISG